MVCMFLTRQQGVPEHVSKKGPSRRDGLNQPWSSATGKKQLALQLHPAGAGRSLTPVLHTKNRDPGRRRRNLQQQLGVSHQLTPACNQNFPPLGGTTPAGSQWQLGAQNGFMAMEGPSPYSMPSHSFFQAAAPHPTHGQLPAQ
jgi:hypothetical protein